MGKITKYGEQISAIPYKNEKKKTRRRTKEEKELIIKKYNELIERGKQSILSQKIEKIRDEEWEKQERDLCVHSETFEKNGILICRLCGEELKKLTNKKEKGIKEKLQDLFCAHREMIEYDEYTLCKKCGEKFPKKRSKK